MIAQIKPMTSDTLSQDLTPEQCRLWNDLNRPPYSAFRKSDKLARPENGTLQWLIKGEPVDQSRDSQPWLRNATEAALCREDFVALRDSNSSGSLLVTAPPGQGKSVLSNFVLEHLECKVLQNLQASKVIYYFCNIKNDEGSRDASSILRALIMQLCERQRQLFRHLPADLEKDSRGFFLEQFSSLCNMFERMLQDNLYERVYCVIDGLDVYKDGMDELIVQLTKIFSPSSRQSTKLKLFCTSRPNKFILDQWGQSPSRILRCDPDDLDIFIRSRISSLESEFDESMRTFLMDSLCERAGTTFLWLDVVIRKIRMIEFPTLIKITEAIEGSPEELETFYGHLVSEARDKSEENARILAWVVYARHPLDLKALGDAIAINSQRRYRSYKEYSREIPKLTPRSVRRNLGTLLDVIEDTVYLIHQSVKDFFQEKDPLQSSFDGVLPRMVLANCCMTYLGLEEFGQQQSIPSDVRLPSFYLPIEFRRKHQKTRES